MIGKEEVYRIGLIGKAHGVKGEITFHFDDDVFDRVDADYIVIEVDGILVPFFIEEYRFKTDSSAIMKLEGIDSQERARELTGSEVFFPRELAGEDDGEQLSLAFLVGFTIVDAATGNDVGIVDRIDDSTVNILFELADGTLIPANDDLITNIDTEHRQIMMQIPEGLLQL